MTYMILLTDILKPKPEALFWNSVSGLLPALLLVPVGQGFVGCMLWGIPSGASYEDLYIMRLLQTVLLSLGF